MNKEQYFEINYHRHGEKEWQISLPATEKSPDKRVVYLTDYIEINVPVVTKFVGKKAVICGIGSVNWSKVRTVISRIQNT